MNDEGFLKKFKGRFETIEKEGIIGIMKTAHIEITNDTLNQYQTYPSSKTRIKSNNRHCSLKINTPLFENKLNINEIEYKKN